MKGDEDQFLLSIWYNNLPDRTIVWYGNDGNTVRKGSKVELTADSGLVLTDAKGNEPWSSGPAPSEVSRGTLNDTGNFMIFNSDSTRLWDSFSNPTDTLLPSQTMEKNGVLYSRLTEANFSKGRFQLRFDTDGALVLNARDIVTNYSCESYYQSGTSDQNESNQGYQVKFNTTGYISIFRRNGSTVNLAPNGEIPPPGNYYYRTTLNYDGVLGQYYYSKDSTQTSAWTAVWQLPENICIAFLDNGGSGACGYNSICRRDEFGRADCQCPQTYSLLDPNDKSSSCKPNFTQNCDDYGSSEDLYDFVQIDNTDWPNSDYAHLSPISEVDCRKQCLDDCFCAVAIYRNNTCWKKNLPLSEGRIDNAAKAFLKYSKGDSPGQGGPTYERKKKKKDTHTLIIVGSVLLGSSFFVNILFAVVA